jgi:hypothetical protein
MVYLLKLIGRGWEIYTDPAVLKIFCAQLAEMSSNDRPFVQLHHIRTRNTTTNS